MRFQSFDTHSKLYAQACELRNEVLRIPIGLDLFNEDLSGECDALHFGIIEAEQLLAYVMIVPGEAATASLKQMCVSSDLQRQGIGAKLIFEVEAELQRLNYQTITMNARTSAVQFYESLGYRRTSGEFTNVGIPHYRMEKVFES